MTTAAEETVVNETEAVQYTYSVAVRFRNAGKPYSFGAFDDSIKRGDWVVVETAQGIEMGEAEADALNIEKYSLHMPQKPVIRRAHERDRYDYDLNIELEKDAFEICEAEIKDLGLEMNLLSAQYTLDRSKILFIYLADQRVDFRELLKRLGARLHCRIELRQIGERDKAKMVGGVGMCGMECCCRRFKNKFDVISINMAKNQMLALNIDKLSGMCGKLMCCLKYEDSDYKEAINGLPKMGSQVEYEGTIYRITSMNVMNSEAKLENRETALFITFDELREKAIPRKGAVMARKPGTEEKKVIYKTVQRTTPKTEPERPAKVSMELPSLAEKKPEKRKENSGRHNNNDRKQNRDHRRNGNDARRDRRQEKPRPEVKNVTVRTFGRKKKQENEA
jgi:cell fate regulator YaaT (PSP1 superfamily)